MKRPKSMPHREPSWFRSDSGTRILCFWSTFCADPRCHVVGWTRSRYGFMRHEEAIGPFMVSTGTWHDHPKAKPAQPVQLDLFELVAS